MFAIYHLRCNICAMSLFESPEILDSCNILGFNLLFKFIWQITEEVDAGFVFQGLDIHHVVAQLIALVESLVLV